MNEPGLTSQEAAARLEKFGPNEIGTEAMPGAWATLRRQLGGAMFWLLVGATALSGLMREWLDASAMLAILVLNTAFAFFQEYRSERALASLKRLSAPKARVRRDGHTREIAAATVVKGDVLVLEAGDIVPADARILEAFDLQANESMLTGESVPVQKFAQPGDNADARTVFMGTAIVTGTAHAEVTETGATTEMGRVATLLQTAQHPATPLQERLEVEGRRLVVICAGVVGLVAIAGALRGAAWTDVVLGAVSLAVAAVPEGLASVVTVALAIGVQRMARRHVIVRQLHAVETLGTATIICTDKTGTLTQGVMRVRESQGSDERRVFAVAAACCDAEYSDAPQVPSMGDPTEIALLEHAATLGIHKRDIEATNPRTEVVPFDSMRRQMSVKRRDGRVFVKGAVEALLPRLRTVPPSLQTEVRDAAARGLRVLLIAEGTGAVDGPLEYVGWVGLSDPPRPEARLAIAQAREAGVTTLMVTGDNAETAAAIARELELLRADEKAEGRVFARSKPGDKLELVRRLKADKQVVAMTGDGVNDAPALREAHIGIAMGKGGSDVAREAAAMVLTDDNYASIIAAIEEGRGVFDNIRKTLVYLLAGNVGELVLMLAAAVAGLPVPLLPLQLLWVNLITDGLPALALAVDPPARDVLKRAPRSPHEPMLGGHQWLYIGIVGTLEATLAFAAFAITLRTHDLTTARTMAFSVLVLAETFRALAARDPDRVFFATGVFSNRVLIGVLAGSFMLQLGVVAFEPTQRLFRLSTLDWEHVAIALGAGLISVTLIEVFKLVSRGVSLRRVAA